jgi:IS5 family transposase
VIGCRSRDFCSLGIEDSISHATTLWLREKLAKAGLIEKLFDRFDQHLGAKGYMAHGGQIVDATIVPVPGANPKMIRIWDCPGRC